MSLQNTPSANRLHIALLGKTNSGKSTFLNALAGQSVALVSERRGTTTDPVYKAMELHGIGPCMLIDTAGFDDDTPLGELRIDKTRQVLDKTDIAILLFADSDLTLEKKWYQELKKKNIPTLLVANKIDQPKIAQTLPAQIEQQLGNSPLMVSAKNQTNLQAVQEALLALLPEQYQAESICGHLVKRGDTVLLIMPQDQSAPKGRLILPQVQTIRELLDLGCITITATPDTMTQALDAMTAPPALIITDSKVFEETYRKTPAQSKLTSFSVLFSRYKGDVMTFRTGADAIDRLTETDTVLIAEACTHNPQDGDIGRVKIPALLRKKVGSGLRIDVVAGADFPQDLSPYALIIHCGGCMYNRKFVQSRIEKAREQKIPITNYGMTIAKLKGILDHIEI